MTQMVPVNLSANETNGACVFPSRPRPASRSNRPDTYQRLPISSKFPLAKRSRSIHPGQKEKLLPTHKMSAYPAYADISLICVCGGAQEMAQNKNIAFVAVPRNLNCTENPRKRRAKIALNCSSLLGVNPRVQ
jgi:hypothetical protein